MALGRPRILIVGAGPAGSLAATLLARSGKADVTLAEASRFPREKVCGECLSDLGFQTLARAGLASRIISAGATRLTRFALHDTTGNVATLALPAPMWGLTRAALDSALLDAAASAGARTLQPARVETVEGGAATIRTQAGCTTETFDFILLADGKSALLPTKPPATGDLGIKAHFRNVRTQSAADHATISLFTLEGHYIGLAPVETGLWNAAMSVPADRVKHFGGDLNALWQAALSQNVALASALEHAEQVGTFLASPLPRFPVRIDWPPGLIPLGNAAAALEPIGGEGMGLALASADAASTEILAALSNNRPVNTAALQATYRGIWNTRRLACRSVALAMSRPRLARLIVSLTGPAAIITHATIRAMGKRSQALAEPLSIPAS